VEERAEKEEEEKKGAGSELVTEPVTEADKERQEIPILDIDRDIFKVKVWI